MAKEKKPLDFVGTFINERVSQPVKREKTVKDEAGVETTQVTELKRRETNFDTLFALAEANGIEVAPFRPQLDEVNGKGRVVMMVSNMLRARARKRHGLHDAEGNWHDVPADFLAANGIEGEPTETRDGTKIKRVKPAAVGADNSAADAGVDTETESAE